MTTAELVIEKTEELVHAGPDDEEAVRQILECCGQKRVSLVVARHHFLSRLEEDPQDGDATKGADLLTAALDLGTWSLTEDIENTT